MRPQPPFRHPIDLPLRDASSGTRKLLIALCVGIPLLATLGHGLAQHHSRCDAAGVVAVAGRRMASAWR